MAYYEIRKIHSRIEYDEYWEHVKANPDRHHLYEPEIEWDIVTINDAQDPEIREIFHGNVCILDKMINLYHQRVHNIAFDDHHIYILKGVQITNEDFYWIMQYEDEPRTIKYMTCVGDIKKVDESLNN